MRPFRELPCPHCATPIALRREQLFPQRRHPIDCPACGRPSRLPLAAALSGLAVVLVLIFAELVLVKSLGLPPPDTLPEILAAAVGLMVLAWVNGYLASLVGSFLVSRLVA